MTRPPISRHAPSVATRASHARAFPQTFSQTLAQPVRPRASQQNFEMQQSELERQTEELAGMLEQDVKDIKRTDVVHCFQMAKKRLVNLFEIVDAGEKKPNGQGSSTG